VWGGGGRHGERGVKWGGVKGEGGWEWERGMSGTEGLGGCMIVLWMRGSIVGGLCASCSVQALI